MTINLNIFNYFIKFEELICQKVAWLLEMKNLNKIENNQSDENDNALFVHTENSLSKPEPISMTERPEQTSSQNFTLKYLKRIADDLQYLKNSVKANNKNENEFKKWKFAAMVIDKLCFVIAVIYTFITSLVIILAFPNFYNFV